MKESRRIFGYHVHIYKALESELINGTEYVFSVQSPYTGKFILVFRFNVALQNNKALQSSSHPPIIQRHEDGKKQ